MSTMSEFAAVVLAVVSNMAKQPMIGAKAAALKIDQTVNDLGETADGLIYLFMVEQAIESIANGHAGSIGHFKVQNHTFSDAGENIRKALGERSLWQVCQSLEAAGHVKSFRYSKVNEKTGKRSTGWFLTALDSKPEPRTKPQTEVSSIVAKLRAAR